MELEITDNLHINYKIENQVTWSKNGVVLIFTWILIVDVNVYHKNNFDKQLMFISRI